MSFVLLKTCALPPTNCFLLGALGLLLAKRWPRGAGAIIAIASIALWFFCTPIVAGALLRSLQYEPALTPNGALPPAEAIVVLSAATEVEAPEYEGESPGRDTLVRMRYGAALQQRTGLPMLVTGGRMAANLAPVAEVMERVFADEFNVEVRWVEPKARDTYENAALSAAILKENDIERVYLVTHAWHLPRARLCFEAHGISVVGAPTGFRGPAFSGLTSLAPSWKALRDSYYALHEWLGLAYYRLSRI